MSLELHPRPRPDARRVKDAACEGVALGLRRYLPETIGLVLIGLATILLAALSQVLLGSSLAWLGPAAAGVGGVYRVWRLQQRLPPGPP